MLKNLRKYNFFFFFQLVFNFTGNLAGDPTRRFWHDFHNMVSKLKCKWYVPSESDPHHPVKNAGSAYGRETGRPKWLFVSVRLITRRKIDICSRREVRSRNGMYEYFYCISLEKKTLGCDLSVSWGTLQGNVINITSVFL